MIIILLLINFLFCKAPFFTEDQYPSLPDHLSLELHGLESEVTQTSTNTIPIGATEEVTEQDEIAIEHPTTNAQQDLDYLQAQESKSDADLCCKICNTTLSTGPNLIKHVTAHLKDVTAYKAQSVLYSHQIFSCEFCERKIYRLDQLDKHLQRMHPNEKQLQCTACNKLCIGDVRVTLHRKSKNIKKRCTVYQKQITPELYI